MPPNTKGGKGYKKKKKVGDSQAVPAYLDREPDQQPARAIRLLGNRNVLCFCNDGVLRICHICGKMKGRVWIEPGDMVLVSLRDLRSDKEVERGAKLETNRGDILGKYHPEHLRKLKKEAGVSPTLFMKLETADGLTLSELGMDLTSSKKLQAAVAGDDDFGFTFEGEGGSGSDEESSDDGGGAGGGAAASDRTAAARARARDVKADADDSDVDIDAI